MCDKRQGSYKKVKVLRYITLHMVVKLERKLTSVCLYLTYVSRTAVVFYTYVLIVLLIAKVYWLHKKVLFGKGVWCLLIHCQTHFFRILSYDGGDVM